MKYKILIVLFLIISCHTSFAGPTEIFLDIYNEARKEVNYVKQSTDEWKLHSEIDLKDVDCDGITFWMGGEAILRGVDASLFQYGIFEYRDEKTRHMAILYDIDGITTVIPSSGLKILSPFMNLDDYLFITDMWLMESFQFIWE